MQTTVRDFLKVIHDRKCGVIVVLSDLMEEGEVRTSRLAVLLYFCFDISSQEVCYQYWPSSGYQAYGEFSVELLGEESLPGFSLRTLGILNSKASLMYSN